MPHDVFVSYASGDKVVADAACAMLETKRLRCWIAPRDVLPGMNYGEAIVGAIRGSRVIVLIFSSRANASQQVMREVERAVHHGVPIIPFRIEDTSPSQALEYYISAPHWLDAMTPPMERHLDRLCTTVAALLKVDSMTVSGADPVPSTEAGAGSGVTPQARAAPNFRRNVVAAVVIATALGAWLWSRSDSPTKSVDATVQPAAGDQDPSRLSVEQLLGAGAPTEAEGSIEGHVVSASDGRPIADAQIEVSADRPEKPLRDGGRAASDAEGRFCLDRIPVGDYRLAATAVGWARFERTVQVTVAQPAQVHVNLSPLPTGSIWGWIVGPDGSPVEGATVRVLDSEGRPLASVAAMTSNETGMCTADDVPVGSWIIEAWTRGGAYARTTADVRAGQDYDFDLELVESALQSSPAGEEESVKAVRSSGRFVDAKAAVAELSNAADSEHLLTLWAEIRDTGLLDDVVAECERRVAADSKKAYLKTDLGQAYLQKAFVFGGTPEAFAWAMKADVAFDGALELDPRHWNARFLKATSLSYWPPSFGKQAEAVRQFEILIEQQSRQPSEPRFAQTHARLGDLYQQLGQAEKAKAAWHSGLVLFPDDTALKNRLESASGK